jgi:hypothetical protein
MRTGMPLVDTNIETLASRFGVAPLGIVPPGGGAGAPWAAEVAKKLVSP